MEGIKSKSIPAERDRGNEKSHGFRNENEVRRVFENHVCQGIFGGVIGNAPTIPVENF